MSVFHHLSPDSNEKKALVLLNRLGIDARRHLAALALVATRPAMRQRLVEQAGGVKSDVWCDVEQSVWRWITDANDTAVPREDFVSVLNSLSTTRRPLHHSNHRFIHVFYF